MVGTETRLELFVKVITVEVTVNLRSRIFERNGKLEMGRMLLKALGSEPGFLRIGVTAADLSDDGTGPEVREDWVLLALRRRSWGVNRGGRVGE